jgi:hypothetical protein
MERSFIMVTAVASTLMFAGVWKATAPTPVVAGPVADTYGVTASPAASARPAAVRRGVLASSPVASNAEPYNVVRPTYGDPAPVSRSGNARSEGSVFYSGCREVRAAGAAPLHRGQPGYRAGMDGDGDGIACENYR